MPLQPCNTTTAGYGLKKTGTRCCLASFLKSWMC
jgi:hypothetical protein